MLSEDVDYLDNRSDALDQLKEGRRSNRIEHIDRFDAFYKAYLGAILAAITLWALAGFFGDEPIRGEALEQYRTYAAYAGQVAVALLVWMGLRSAARGGPLAFEQADVRHILLAPVDRADSVAGPARTLLRHHLFIGASVGAGLGLVASRRLPDHPATVVAVLALAGAVVGVFVSGVSLLGGGLRIRPGWADIFGVALVGWALADAAVTGVHSPLWPLATTAQAPLAWSPWQVVGLLMAMASAVIGLRFCDGISLENAERRERLIGQLRFAATTQDVRTVMLIQRQLSQQRLRAKPWIKLGQAKQQSEATTMVVARRNLASMLRWPASRYLRQLAFFVTYAASLIAAWNVSGFFIVTGGLALWLAAIDLMEGLAQEADRSNRLDSAATQRGVIYLRHLALPSVFMSVGVIVWSLPAQILAPTAIVEVLSPVLVSVVGLSIGGAALVTSRGPDVETGYVSAEVTGLKMLLKAGIPPTLPVFSLLPVVLARNEWVVSGDAEATFAAINLASAGGLAFATWAILWVRYSESLREAFTPKPVVKSTEDGEKP